MRYGAVPLVGRVLLGSIILGGGATVSSCSPARPGPERFVFRYTIATGPVQPDSVSVQSEPGGIRIGGILRAPSPTYKLRAQVAQEGAELQLNVGAYLETPVSTGMLTPLTYDARIPVAASGMYRLRVVYHIDRGFQGEAPPRKEVAWEGRVRVP